MTATANGYLEQRQSSPLSFGAVVLIHGAAIAAVLLVKGPGWIVEPTTILKTYPVSPVEPPPPVELPRPEPEVRQNPPISRLDVPPRVIPTPAPTQPVFSERTVTPPGSVIGRDPGSSAGSGIVTVPPRTPPRVPVRVAAQWDSRFTGAMQPPYPASEERAEREGTVRARVTIAPSGRVTAIQRVSATNDVFWRATERQALSNWRFRPATLDGQPVQGSMTVNIQFRIDG